MNWDPGARWVVFEALASEVVILDGGEKAKVPRGVVLCSGDRATVTSFLVEQAPGRKVHGATVNAGNRGTATAGDWGTATAGDSGTATAGDSGTATAGDSGILSLRWWDGKRYRVSVFYVGEDGIEPNVAYRCENGKAVKAVK